MERIDKARFCVGTPTGPCGNVWFISAQKNNIYFGVKSVSGQIKASLHESGEGHIALTSEYIKKWPGEFSKRKFVTWTIPSVPKTGLVHIGSITFPSFFIKRSTSDQHLFLKKRGFRFATPSDGKACELGFFLSMDDPDKTVQSFAPVAEPIFLFHNNGRFLWLAAREVEFDHNEFLGKITNVNMTVMPEHRHEDPVKKEELSWMCYNNPQESAGVFFFTETHGLAIQS